MTGDGRSGAPGNSQLRGWVSPPDSLGGSGRAPGQKSAVPVHGRVLPALRCCRKGARQGGGRSSAGFRGHLSVAHGHYDQSGWVEGSRRWYATTAPPLPSATTGGSRKRRCGGGCFAFPDVLIPISSSGNGGIGQHAAGQGAPQHRERRRSCPAGLHRNRSGPVVIVPKYPHDQILVGIISSPLPDAFQSPIHVCAPLQDHRRSHWRIRRRDRRSRGAARARTPCGAFDLRSSTRARRAHDTRDRTKCIRS